LVRLQKFLSECGVASRRAGEQLIRTGHITVNGQTVQALGTKVHPGRDEIAMDGQPVRLRRKLHVALNKPPGFLCTRQDPLNRPIIFDLLPREWSHLTHVGRLDRESEGLIFLTNDGQFALRLTHPRYGIRKSYRVTAEGRVVPALLRKFTAGLEDCGELLKAEKARLISSNNTQSVLEIELAEGKNREIRRLLAAVDLNVIRLERIQIGPIKLGELPAGKWRTLTEREIKSLLAPL
jgi:23S rRNA pseudouridine2605 synthase